MGRLEVRCGIAWGDFPYSDQLQLPIDHICEIVREFQMACPLRVGVFILSFQNWSLCIWSLLHKENPLPGIRVKVGQLCFRL